jgi:hypothetical protein
VLSRRDGVSWETAGHGARRRHFLYRGGGVNAGSRRKRGGWSTLDEAMVMVMMVVVVVAVVVAVAGVARAMLMIGACVDDSRAQDLAESCSWRVGQLARSNSCEVGAKAAEALLDSTRTLGLGC